MLVTRSNKYILNINDTSSADTSTSVGDTVLGEEGPAAFEADLVHFAELPAEVGGAELVVEMGESGPAHLDGLGTGHVALEDDVVAAVAVPACTLELGRHAVPDKGRVAPLGEDGLVDEAAKGDDEPPRGDPQRIVGDLLQRAKLLLEAGVVLG